jgi:ferredoxin-type protein NapF
LGLDKDDDDACVDPSRRALLRDVGRPISHAQRGIKEVEQALKTNEPGPPRPPGALTEALFQATCTACGECKKACPYEAIELDESGFPTFAMTQAWCHFCAELPCLNACQDGALVEGGTLPSIGVVVLDRHHCLNVASMFCSVCAERCPEDAIQIVRGEVTIDTTLCNGCGECVYRCPSPLNALRVVRH